MYGTYSPPLKIKTKKLSINFSKKGEGWEYKRSLSGEEKRVSTFFSKGKIIINPVEPVNVPKEISSHLLIELEKEVVLAPKERIKLYLKFPIEIGVLLSTGKNYRVLDVFTFTKPKYTLYGSIKNGIICKYWKSDISTKIPKVNALEEGVIEVDITNKSGEWVNIVNLVFQAHGMKIYYNKNLVSMKSVVSVINDDVAEIDFINAPLKEDMKKSIELYIAKKLIPLTGKFVMEEGV